MRIVFLISHFPPEYIGGAEIQTSYLAKRLSEKGHKIMVLTAKWKKHQLKEEKRNGYLIKRFRILNLPVLKFLSHLFFSLNEIRKIRKKIDILQCIILTPNGLIGVIAKKLWNIKVSSWIRGGDWYFTRDNPLERLMISFIIKNSDIVLVQTPKIKKEVLNEFPDAKIEVVPNGIDVPKENTKGNKIIFVGNLIWRKGVEYLLEAMKHVNEDLIIVGDGPEKKKLMEMAKCMKNVVFVGRTCPEMVKNYLKKGKVLVLPSIAGEGQPNVILEAMSLGIPVVTTNLAGIPDMVKHGETGFLVKPKDSESLAKYINLLLKDKKLWRKMSKNCKKEVKKYSWENVIGILEKIYQSLSKGR